MTQTHPWQVIGKDAKTGKVVDRIFHSRSGREAQREATAAGIIIEHIEPVHADVEAPATEQVIGAARSREDWRQLEITIARGVFRGVVWLVIAWFVLSVAVALILMLITGAFGIG